MMIGEGCSRETYSSIHSDRVDPMVVILDVINDTVKLSYSRIPLEMRLGASDRTRRRADGPRDRKIPQGIERRG